MKDVACFECSPVTGFVWERIVGAKKITGIEKVSAAGEPAPEGLRHHAVADRSEVLPASASESLVSPPPPDEPAPCHRPTVL